MKVLLYNAQKAGMNFYLKENMTVRVEFRLIDEFGKQLKVWEVKLWRSGGQEKGEGLISSSRVTLLSNMAAPESLRNAAGEALKKHAKL